VAGAARSPKPRRAACCSRVVAWRARRAAARPTAARGCARSPRAARPTARRCRAARSSPSVAPRPRTAALACAAPTVAARARVVVSARTSAANRTRTAARAPAGPSPRACFAARTRPAARRPVRRARSPPSAATARPSAMPMGAARLPDRAGRRAGPAPWAPTVAPGSARPAPRAGSPVGTPARPRARPAPPPRTAARPARPVAADFPRAACRDSSPHFSPVAVCRGGIANPLSSRGRPPRARRCRWKPWEGFHTFPRYGFGGQSPPAPTRMLARTSACQASCCEKCGLVPRRMNDAGQGHCRSPGKYLRGEPEKQSRRIVRPVRLRSSVSSCCLPQ
jgi:hypothetical protein